MGNVYRGQMLTNVLAGIRLHTFTPSNEYCYYSTVLETDKVCVCVCVDLSVCKCTFLSSVVLMKIYGKGLNPQLISFAFARVELLYPMMHFYMT